MNSARGLRSLNVFKTQFSQKIFIVTAHTGNNITLHYHVKALEGVVTYHSILNNLATGAEENKFADYVQNIDNKNFDKIHKTFSV